MSYEKETWQSGDVITAAKMNHIEDGVVTISSGGGYEPTIWSTGDVITAAKMNKIEQGIVTAANIDSSDWELLYTEDFSISISSSSNTSIKRCIVPINYDSTKILYIMIKDTNGERPGYYYSSDQIYLDGITYSFFHGCSINAGANFWTNISNSSQPYGGIYIYGIYTTETSIVLPIFAKYSSVYCGTIDGTYNISVYYLSLPN